MSLPPIPSGQWFWGKGTPAGGLKAWLEQLRGNVVTLEADRSQVTADRGVLTWTTGEDNEGGRS